ncbi:MAG: DMT family transporter [Actinomycetota bacterium]|nr:DMT family transporter [Actinomycetota bacterium]
MPNHLVHRRVPMLVAATACWGIGTVLTKQVLGEVAPLTLLPIQLAASCLLLAAIAVLTRARRDRSSRFRWPLQTGALAALGVLNPGLAYALGLLGLSSISASMSVLLWAAEPVLILLLAAALLRERIPGALAAALGTAILGVLLVVYQPDAAGDTAGIALTLSAVGACALYTVLIRRLLLDDASLALVLTQQVAALLFALLLATAVQLITGKGWSAGNLPGTTWIAAAASGVLYYGLAFWFYLAGLRYIPASVAGAFLPLIPVFGVAAGYLVGERLGGRQWTGAAIVVIATAAVALIRLEPNRQFRGL